MDVRIKYQTRLDQLYVKEVYSVVETLGETKNLESLKDKFAVCGRRCSDVFSEIDALHKKVNAWIEQGAKSKPSLKGIGPIR